MSTKIVMSGAGDTRKNGDHTVDGTKNGKQKWTRNNTGQDFWIWFHDDSSDMFIDGEKYWISSKSTTAFDVFFGGPDSEYLRAPADPDNENVPPKFGWTAHNSETAIPDICTVDIEENKRGLVLSCGGTPDPTGLLFRWKDMANDYAVFIADGNGYHVAYQSGQWELRTGVTAFAGTLLAHCLDDGGIPSMAGGWEPDGGWDGDVFAVNAWEFGYTTAALPPLSIYQFDEWVADTGVVGEDPGETALDVVQGTSPGHLKIVFRDPWPGSDPFTDGALNVGIVFDEPEALTGQDRTLLALRTRGQITTIAGSYSGAAKMKFGSGGSNIGGEYPFNLESGGQDCTRWLTPDLSNFPADPELDALSDLADIHVLIEPGGNNTCLNVTTFEVDARYSYWASLAPGLADYTVSGNAVVIESGDTTPSVTDDTDFGTTDTGAPVAHEFTIEVDGGTITISGDIELSGANADQFSITQPETTESISSETFTVTFNPTSAGVKTATVSFDAGGNPSTYTFDITGTAQVTIREAIVSGNGVEIDSGDTTPSVADHTDFEECIVDLTEDRTYTIEAGVDNEAALSIGTITIEGDDADQFEVHAQVGDATLDAEETTTFTIRFSPTSEGAKVATVVIPMNRTDENGTPIAGDFEFDIAGDCVPVPSDPELEVYGNDVLITSGDATPDPADDTDFGNVDFGNNTDVVFELNEAAGLELTLTGTPKVVLSGANAADFEVTDQPTSPIEAFGGDTFTIRFTPSAVGVRSATVTIASNDPASPFTFAIQGTGRAFVPEVADETLEVSIANGDDTPSTEDGTDFGDVIVHAGGSEHTFTITNAGEASGNVTGPATLSGDGAYAFTITGQPTTDPLAPDAATDLVVSVDPTIAGVVTATVSIPHSGPDSPFTFDITATGVVAPEITVTGNGVEIVDADATPSSGDWTAFGNVYTNTYAERTYRITNDGSGDLSVTMAEGSGDFAVVHGAGAQVIPAGESALVVVRFTPSSAEAKTGTLTITSDDEDEGTYTFALSGTGVAPVSGGGGNSAKSNIRVKRKFFPILSPDYVHDLLSELIPNDTVDEKAKGT
jgi:hypothetical protein